jgi:hypothetical protein
MDEFLRRNADDIYLLQEGHYEILHERQLERDAALSKTELMIYGVSGARTAEPSASPKEQNEDPF